jgi:hypothetical protein
MSAKIFLKPFGKGRKMFFFFSNLLLNVRPFVSRIVSAYFELNRAN